MGERTCVEVLGECEVLADLVLKVGDIGAAVVPSKLLLLGLLLTVDSYLHAVVEHRVRLVVIQDVELDWQARTRVLHTEIEPLSVAMSIDIVLHEAVVLLIAHLSRQKQIA